MIGWLLALGVMVMALMPSMITVSSWWPIGQPIRLGLDLRGGTHLLYGVDLDEAVRQSLASRSRELELALRLADYMEFADLLAIDAQQRRESCGCHFREEFQTEDGEAKRNDAEFAYVAAWEFTGVGKEPILHKEPLSFENVSLSQRSYK